MPSIGWTPSSLAADRDGAADLGPGLRGGTSTTTREGCCRRSGAGRDGGLVARSGEVPAGLGLL